MIQPRWKKIRNELTNYKLRTFLVVMSITIGVFAIGVTAGTQIMLTEDLAAAYNATQPGHAILFTDDFTTGFLHTLEQVEGVTAVDARKRETVILHLPSGEQTRLNLITRLDFNDMHLHTMTPTAGAWPPPTQSIVIERASLPYVGTNLGETITVETANGRLHTLTLAGTADDMMTEPVQLTDEPNGFVSRETMSALGYGRGLNEIYLTVAGINPTEKEIEAVTDRVQFKTAVSGRIPYFAETLTPGVHPATEDVEPMIWLLGLLSFLSLFTSAFLIINIITAVLTQQTRQIGVMKTIGADSGQMMGMYLVLVLLFGLLALLIAVPLAALAAYGLTSFMASLINFDLAGFRVEPTAVFIQTIMALLIPLLAALVPVWRGSHMSVRAAINQQGQTNKSRFGIVDRAIYWLSASRLHLSGPLRLSIRNAIRQKGRLILTLSMLTLGTALFIAVMSVQASLLAALDDALDYFAFDVSADLVTSYPKELVEQTAWQTTGITAVETWFSSSAQPRNTGGDGMAFAMIGLAPDVQTIQPQIVNGRWLQPDDTNAIVLDSLVLNREPNIQLGDTIRLKIDGLTLDWQVVGFAEAVLTEDGVAYANYPYLTQQLGKTGQVNRVNVIGNEAETAVTQYHLANNLRQQLAAAKLQLAYTAITADIRDGLAFEFSLIIILLAVMAVLVSLIGGLGLTGTMSINVLERTREIGVMRALGASNSSIGGMVLAEGTAVAIISWLLGVLLAVPLGMLLRSAVGNEIIESPLTHQYAFGWATIWLGGIVIIAVIASLIPAWKASRLSIRETLAYE